MTEPFVCTNCGGRCRAYAGSVHGWTCRKCLDEYISRQNDAPAHRINAVTKRIIAGDDQ